MSLAPSIPDTSRSCFAQCPPGKFCKCLGMVIPRNGVHASSCGIHNGPAFPAGPCDCGSDSIAEDLDRLLGII